ncbi:hypothetical protein GCM10022226_53680 [Sphaerisporangium flaviroseum]|uniref:Uncharacterized protein n=1 Tax=Sphaerisporangium flaviroseum TaxID=509199 RepID=A0ABP7ITU0_9ACTN
MATWTVWRQDDIGNTAEVARYDDRVEALARVLKFEAGHPHKQTYWVAGDVVPLTNRDLYRRITALRAVLVAGERTLPEYLRALWHVSRTRSDRDRLPLDEVAAMLTAAATLAPPPADEVTSTPAATLAQPPADEVTSTPAATSGPLSAEVNRDFVSEVSLSGFARWEAVITSQIADLDDFALQPPGDDAYFGVDAPRTSGPRATPRRWYNLHPATYLECGLAGAFGGWDESDGLRIAVPGPVHPDVPMDTEVVQIDALTWDDLADFALCGQTYE